MNQIRSNPLTKKLLSLGLLPEDYAIFGSGPMFAHGIKDWNDVDVIARKKAWERALTLGKPTVAPLAKQPVVVLFDGAVEIYSGWAPGEWTIDALIDTAEEFEGIRFVTLDNVLRWKKLMGRSKDLEHIKMIVTYLDKSSAPKNSPPKLTIYNEE